MLSDWRRRRAALYTARRTGEEEKEDIRETPTTQRVTLATYGRCSVVLFPDVGGSNL